VVGVSTELEDLALDMSKFTDGSLSLELAAFSSSSAMLEIKCKCDLGSCGNICICCSLALVEPLGDCSGLEFIEFIELAEFFRSLNLLSLGLGLTSLEFSIANKTKFIVFIGAQATNIFFAEKYLFKLAQNIFKFEASKALSFFEPGEVV